MEAEARELKMKFVYKRAKFVVIDAEQWFPGKHIEGVEPYTDPDSRVYSIMVDHLPWGADPNNYGYLRTCYSDYVVSCGDWILTDVDGEKYVCSDKKFNELYEELKDE